MPRQLREEEAGGVFHMYARGNNRNAVFLDDRDRRTYLTMLARAANWQRWHLLGYCLLDNHVHLLAETPLPSLGAGIQQAHGAYAQIFNRRHERTGHVFQGRFGAVRVRDDAHMWAVTRYVMRNPVEGGVCRDPRTYAWCSHAEMLSASAPSWLARDRLLSYFGGSGGDMLSRYLEAVEAT